MTEFRQLVGFDDSLELEDGGSGHVERQWNAHRGRDEQRVSDDRQSLEAVHVDTFLEFVDELRTSAHSCSTSITIIISIIIIIVIISSVVMFSLQYECIVIHSLVAPHTYIF